MPSLQDLAPEDGDQDRYKSKDRAPRNTSRGWQKRNSRPKQDTTTGDKPQSKGQKNVRPEEVSEDVWGMAEHWLDLGEAHFEKRPPLNKQAFSKRLSDKINSDPTLRKFLRIRPERWEHMLGGSFKSGPDFVNEVLYQAVRLFWKYLTTEHGNSPALQFLFLDEEWDEWIYQAVTTVQVGYYHKHGEWSEPTLPSRVFDPSTAGMPNPDDLCTDPTFEGMTWGQVWAQDDHELFGERSEEPIARPDHPRIAMPKHAKVARRKTHTTKETTDD